MASTTFSETNGKIDLEENQNNNHSNSIADRKNHQLGVSVDFLNSEVFRKDLQSANVDYSTAKIYDMEPNLSTPGSSFGLLRSKDQHITCPRDGERGAAYVDSIGPDCVGPANVMLSYSWGYNIKDVVDCLRAKCANDNRDPKKTFVWICCFCNNQHRIGKTVVSFDKFRKTFL